MPAVGRLWPSDDYDGDGDDDGDDDDDDDDDDDCIWWKDRVDEGFDNVGVNGGNIDKCDYLKVKISIISDNNHIG